MKLKYLLCYEYSEGQLVPWWLGFVRRNYWARSYTVAPLGLNILFFVALSFYRFIKGAAVDFDRFHKDRLDAKKSGDSKRV
jgi:hypothetical protein